MPTQTKSKSKKKAAPPNILNVAFVWDMSGSMASIRDATKEGTRGYLMDLIKDEKLLQKKHGESTYTHLSLTAFDTVFEQWVVDEPITEISVSKLIDRYEPRGMTALYDAIAKTITDLESKLATEDRSEEKCLVVVMTDGEENSSREYSVHADGKRRLFNLIKRLETKGTWTFVYLGANVDAYAEAAAIGIPQGNAAYYSASPASVHSTQSSLSHVTRSNRSQLRGSSTAFADAGQTQDYRDEEDK